eukprot:6388113-Prymnesium_polylepis.1
MPAVTRDSEGNKADAIAVWAVGRAEADREETEHRLVVDGVESDRRLVDTPAAIVVLYLELLEWAKRSARVRTDRPSRLHEAAAMVAQADRPEDRPVAGRHGGVSKLKVCHQRERQVVIERHRAMRVQPILPRMIATLP